MPRSVALAACALFLLAAAPAQGRDERGSFSIQVENDLFGGSDRHYTHGMRIGWLSAEGDVPGLARRLARHLPLLDPAGRLRVGYAVGQNIYTPDDITARTLQVDDRPYAGWLYGEFGLVSESGRRLDTVMLSLGVVGPLSQADDVQRTWHQVFDFTFPEGWDHQLENEPALNLMAERRWRGLAALEVAGLELDLSPHMGGSLGNVFTYGALGATVRLGSELESDFGPPLIRPSLPGSSHFTPRAGASWYLFAGVEGRAVARNIFLDGNTFADSHSVDKRRLVGDIQFGIALTFPRFRLTYTQVLRTKEFFGQKTGDVFGAVSLTARF